MVVTLGASFAAQASFCTKDRLRAQWTKLPERKIATRIEASEQASLPQYCIKNKIRYMMTEDDSVKDGLIRPTLPHPCISMAVLAWAHKRRLG